MPRIVYVNGHFLPEEQAQVSIFDRGFLFADAVYEVCAVINGKLLDNTAHLARLDRSLNEISLLSPASHAEIQEIQTNLIEQNHLQEGLIYLQISRGPADRDFAFPEHPNPSMVMFTQAKSLIDNPKAESGIRIITRPDLRWKRRDIKTTNLLPAALAKQMAIEAGVDDTWMVENDHITEGTSNNAFIVTKDGTLRTRTLSTDILHGITRQAILELSRSQNLNIEERPFTVAEAKQASEAFSTSASSFVVAVVEIDGTIIGNGELGPLTKKLRQLYLDRALGV